MNGTRPRSAPHCLREPSRFGIGWSGRRHQSEASGFSRLPAPRALCENRPVTAESGSHVTPAEWLADRPQAVSRPPEALRRLLPGRQGAAGAALQARILDSARMAGIPGKLALGCGLGCGLGCARVRARVRAWVRARMRAWVRARMRAWRHGAAGTSPRLTGQGHVDSVLALRITAWPCGAALVGTAPGRASSRGGWHGDQDWTLPCRNGGRGGARD